MDEFLPHCLPLSPLVSRHVLRSLHICSKLSPFLSPCLPSSLLQTLCFSGFNSCCMLGSPGLPLSRLVSLHLCTKLCASGWVRLVISAPNSVHISSNPGASVSLCLPLSPFISSRNSVQNLSPLVSLHMRPSSLRCSLVSLSVRWNGFGWTCFCRLVFLCLPLSLFTFASNSVNQAGALSPFVSPCLIFSCLPALPDRRPRARQCAHLLASQHVPSFLPRCCQIAGPHARQCAPSTSAVSISLSPTGLPPACTLNCFPACACIYFSVLPDRRAACLPVSLLVCRQRCQIAGPSCQTGGPHLFQCANRGLFPHPTCRLEGVARPAFCAGRCRMR